MIEKFQIVCYTDSKAAIAIIAQNKNPHHRYAAFIVDIQELLRQQWSVRVFPSWREGNTAADHLAGPGMSGILFAHSTKLVNTP